MRKERKSMLWKRVGFFRTKSYKNICRRGQVAMEKQKLKGMNSNLEIKHAIKL